jgi:LysM repeat protein
MKKIGIIILFLYSATSFAQYNDEIVYEYIDKYKDLAVKLMETSHIPASIKIAQAIYSSNAGTNTLSKYANNHFGILCHEKYTGEIYYDPADITHTCYRKYASVEDSYNDHSKFLTERSRYNKLFTLEIDDYKGWAKGLQEASYSINPNYSNQLINIIETYFLYLYDNPESELPTNIKDEIKTNLPETPAQIPVKKESVQKNIISDSSKIYNTKKIAEHPKEKPNNDSIKRDTLIESGIEVIIERKIKTQESCGKDSVAIVKTEEQPVIAKVFTAKEMEYQPVYYPYTSRTVYVNNKIKFIIAEKGDSYEKIGKDVQITESNLRLFNDIFDDNYEPIPGEVVYLQYKNKKSEVSFHTIEKGETMKYIAQKYAVPLKLIFARNNYQMSEFSVGNIICISCKK